MSWLTIKTYNKRHIIIDNEFISTEIHEEQLLIIFGVETNGKRLLGECFYEWRQIKYMYLGALHIWKTYKTLICKTISIMTLYTRLSWWLLLWFFPGNTYLSHLKYKFMLPSYTWTIEILTISFKNIFRASSVSL